MAIHAGVRPPVPSADEPAELVLHIGFAKTGTSAVQARLAHGRADLAAHGIVYPELGIRFNAHHGLADLLIEHKNASIPPPDATASQLLEELERAVGAGARRIVLSSEGLSTARAFRPIMDELTDRYSVRVVAAMRPVLSWVDSLLNQMTKTAMFRAPDWDQRAVTRQLLRRGARFDHQLAIWEQVVGVENMGLVALASGDDYSSECLEAIGVSQIRDVPVDPTAANPSAGLDELHFLGWFADGSPEPDHDHKVRVARWLRTYDEGSQEPFCLIHPELVEEAALVAAEVSRAISERYFSGASVLSDATDLSTAVTTDPVDPARVLRVARHVLAESDRDRRRLVRALEREREGRAGPADES